MKQKILKNNSADKSNHFTNLLKFINQENSLKRPQGKKCFPQHLFGISSDAPTQFCTKNTIVLSKEKTNRQSSLSTNQPQFFSQKNFFKIGYSSQKNDQKARNNFITSYTSSAQNNKLAFRTKSSRMSQFFDKNAWMGDRFQVMGHQRSNQALKLSKFQHSNKITKQNFHNPRRTMSSLNFTKKSSMMPTSESMKKFLQSQEMRIKTSKIQFIKNKEQEQSQQQIIRPKTSSQVSRSKSLILQKEKSNLKQFKINFLEWGHKDFAINFLDWNPQKNKKQSQSKREGLL